MLRAKDATPAVAAIAFAALALPYFLNLGASSLWDTNEAFYAETPREMLESGDYLAPQFNFQPRTQKPPLTYWLIALSYRVLGVSEFALRLPGALAAAGLLCFTYLIARLSFSRWAALGATAILATTARVFMLARRLPIDILLLFWLTGTAYFLIKCMRRDSLRDWILACVFAGFGFLAKGPVAWLIPGMTYLIAVVGIRRQKPAWARLFLGVLAASAVVAPWYWMVYLRHGGQYITSFFVRDNLGRYLSDAFGPSRGPWYYLGVFAVDYFPWSVLSLAAMYRLWLLRKPPPGFRNSPYAFPLVWCAVTMLFFSFSRNKQEYYIAPVYPMMSLLIAGLLEQTIRRDAAETGCRTENPWAGAFLAASIAVLTLAVALLVAAPVILPDLPDFWMYLPAAVMAAASAASAVYSIRRRPPAAFASIAAGLCLLYLLGASFYLPASEPLRPIRDLCTLIEARWGPEDEAGYYRVSVPSMVFYLRRPIFEEFEADSMVRRFQGPRRVFCIMTERDHNFFVGRKDLVLYILERRPRLVSQFRGLIDESYRLAEELVLVSNRPPDEATNAAGSGNP
jgi:4-amino-4-deoxy-L-arabinose transferase-like glycosyltransferase